MAVDIFSNELLLMIIDVSSGKKSNNWEARLLF